MKHNEPKHAAHKPRRRRSLPKAPTGIQGLDELTGGGLPKGRPTLLCGGAGSGKTLLAMEFLVHGATDYGEPGVFMAFEETTGELATNFASLGYDLKVLVAQKKLALRFVHIDRSEIEEAGKYDLEGLFIRLGQAIDSIGAKRVVLDTIEVLFSGLSNTAALRSELGRLFRWLKEKGVTTIVTGERGESKLTRYGLEEYVADCVIMLDNRLEGQMATRRLRIVKYRGSTHGTGECPFLIDEGGISMWPHTMMGLQEHVDTKRVSSGIPRLDAMMGGRGFYRGSTVMVSGAAGSGKTSMAAHFAVGTIVRGERCLWLSFEESSSQIIRNMRSIGIDLEPAVRRGMLRIHAVRPTMFGLEMHLATILKAVSQHRPRGVIIDPVTAFASLGSQAEVESMVTRLMDFFKIKQITALLTCLNSGGAPVENADLGISSLVDTWLLLRDVQNGSERNRFFDIVKSRGMAHSNQVREFLLTDHGVELRDVYVGPSGLLLAGGAREALEAQETAQILVRGQETEFKTRTLESKRQALEAQIAVLQAQFEIEEAEAAKTIIQDQTRAGVLVNDRVRMALQRQSDPGDGGKPPRRKKGHSS